MGLMFAIRRMIAVIVLVAVSQPVLSSSTPAPAPAAAPAPAPAPACERAPAHAQPADALYRLGIAGDPDLFLPGELYTVSLQGVDSGEGPTPFIGFTIWTEIETELSEGKEADIANVSLGMFQSYDAQTKNHELCSPAVTNATTHPKIEIQVIWSAPQSSTEVCIRLCARASPSLSPRPAPAPAASILARKLCAAPAAPASFVRQPPIVEPCCACDEAKYEVTFEGVWSRNTHPRQFPADSRAHFGDVIGASHTAQYRVWQAGRAATAGLRRLADDGATTALEKELKAESEHIRTIIKARGISWQQVASAVAPSTFAVFRVDAKNHLVSLAAKLAPSPDWIVGVSALELCNANCTWRRSITLPLYPFDAGTDGGLGYTSARQPTVPASPVRALRPDWPKDERSPFYNTKGDMRPFARLRLNRLRLYEKSCDTVEAGADRPAEPKGGSCATHEWGPWTPCSVTCGEGRASRQRQYIWPARAYTDACRVPLTDHKRCFGPRRHCRAPTEDEPDPATSTGPCAVSQWSAWSPCAGCGIRARTRHYVAERAHKRCSTGFRAGTVMSQAMPCDAGPCHTPPDQTNSTNFDWFFVDKPNGPCPVSSWSSWSPCSSRCGRGRTLRTRLHLPRPAPAPAPAPPAPALAHSPAPAPSAAQLQTQLTRRLVAQWNRRFAELQGLTVPSENVTSDDPELSRQVDEYLERCQFTMTLQEALCDGDAHNCTEKLDANDSCSQPMSVGPCRGYNERWFYDVTRATCEPFGYTGCGGNANNFRSRDECNTACDGVAVAATVAPPSANESNVKKNKQVLLTNQDNEVMQHDAPASDEESVECVAGPWLAWSRCLGDCDHAVKLNYRLVERNASGSGRPCHNLVKSRACRPSHCKKLILIAASEHVADNRTEASNPDYD